MIYEIDIFRAENREETHRIYKRTIIETPSLTSDITQHELDMVIAAFQSVVPQMVRNMFSVQDLSTKNKD